MAAVPLSEHARASGQCKRRRDRFQLVQCK
jgi:hypothetical protein